MRARSALRIPPCRHLALPQTVAVAAHRQQRATRIRYKDESPEPQLLPHGITQDQLVARIRAELEAEPQPATTPFDEALAGALAQQQVAVLRAGPEAAAALPREELQSLLASQGCLTYQAELRRRRAEARGAAGALRRECAVAHARSLVIAAQRDVDLCDVLLDAYWKRHEMPAEGSQGAEEGEGQRGARQGAERSEGQVRRRMVEEDVAGLMEVRQGLLEYIAANQQLLAEEEREEEKQ